MKKVLSGLISFCMLLTCMIMPASANTSSELEAYAREHSSHYLKIDSQRKDNQLILPERHSPDEVVTFIVEVTGEPALAKQEAQKLGASMYVKTKEYKKSEEENLLKQKKVFDTIKRDTFENAEKGYTYTALFNGFSITAPYQKMEEIKALPGVKNVFVSEEHKFVKPKMSSASDMCGLNDFRTSTALNGEGQVICVIDTEFDVNHDFFSTPVENPHLSKTDIENILKNNKMNVDVKANQVYRNSKIPFAYDYANKNSDTFNDSANLVHGTHVLGIASGKNGTDAEGKSFNGVAYESQAICMKASNQNGTFSDSVILAAMDDASKFGVCAINLSLGADFMPVNYSNAYDSVLANSRNAGIMVCAAAGNADRGFSDGREPILTKHTDYSTGGTPCGYSMATSVASVDNTNIIIPLGRLNFGDKCVNYQTGTGASDFSQLSDGGEIELVYCKYGFPEDFPADDLTGKVALIKRGKNTFANMTKLAKSRGMKALAIINADETYITTTVNDFPVAVVKKSSGDMILSLPAKICTVEPVKNRYDVSLKGGQSSSFTSWSTSDDLNLKPEISSPGGGIYSSVPNNKYGVFSGTSMATPYMTGVNALFNQFYASNPYIPLYNGLNGNDKVDLFENIFMSSSDIIMRREGVPESPRRQGAGLVNIDKASKTPVIIKGTEGKTKINLGNNIDDRFTLDFTLTNLKDKDITFKKPVLYVLTDGYYEENGETYIEDMAPLTVKEVNLPESLTLQGSGEENLSISVVLDSAELNKNAAIFTSGFYIDGFLSFTTQDGLYEAHIPFTGYRGDIRDGQYFDNKPYGDEEPVVKEMDAPYFSGTVLSTVANSSLVRAGMNVYADNFIFDERYIAVSPDNDGNMDSLMLSTHLLKNISGFGLKLYDDKGTLISQDDQDAVLSKVIGFRIGIGDLTSVKEGKYRIEFDAKSNYIGKQNMYKDSVSFPFVVDKTAPMITSMSLDEKNKTLTVQAKDNHFISAMMLLYVDNSGNVKSEKAIFAPDPSIENGDNFEHIFNLKTDDFSDFLVVCSDYAMNESETLYSDYQSDILFDISSIDANEMGAVVDTVVTNKLTETFTGDVVLSFFDTQGRLLNTGILKNAQLNPGGNNLKIKVRGDVRSSGKLVGFIFESLQNLKPYIEKQVFTLR